MLAAFLMFYSQCVGYFPNLMSRNMDTPVVYMLCVEITCRVQVLPAAAAFLLLHTRPHTYFNITSNYFNWLISPFC